MKLKCPHCGQHLEAEREHLGTQVACPTCGKPLDVPDSLPSDWSSEEDRPSAPPEPGRMIQRQENGKRCGKCGSTNIWTTTAWDGLRDRCLDCEPPPENAEEKVAELMAIIEAKDPHSPQAAEDIEKIGPAGQAAIPLLRRVWEEHGYDPLGCAAKDALRTLEELNGPGTAPSPHVENPSSIDEGGGLGLRCSHCGEQYALGVDACITSLGDAISFMAGQGTAVIGKVGGMLANTPDLVARIPEDCDDREERVGNTLARVEAVKEILASSSQTPQWTCHQCKNDNAYPRNIGALISRGKGESAMQDEPIARGATASLTLGILAFFTWCLLIGVPIAIMGLVRGHAALGEIKKSTEPLAGKNRAVAGLILSYLSIFFLLLVIGINLLAA